MVLTVQEESLIKVVRALPRQEADRVLEWARHLADLSGAHAIDWSDQWSSQDLVDAAAASLDEFDAPEHKQN